MLSCIVGALGAGALKYVCVNHGDFFFQFERVAQV